MPKQPTKKRKAEGPHSRPKDTKKLQKASYQPALNRLPRPASATASSLSERAPLPSLTSDSIEDSSSSTVNYLVDKSSASTASIEKHSSAPSVTRASSTSMLQETRPSHGGAQETKELTWREFRTMSREQLKEYARSRGWRVRT
jgi:hypothetical protein